MTPMSKEDTQLQIQLARIRMEASEERAQIRKDEFDLRLQIRRLEIEAEKVVQLRRLELEGAKAASVAASPVATAASSADLDTTIGSTMAFNVSRNLPLVPIFRETEVDRYFSVFERIATSLGWPKTAWSLMLQCRLVGKAMEVYSTLSVEDTLQYDIVKVAILRAYELVPEAYRQKFRNHKKSNSQTFVEFAHEKGILFDKWCMSSKVTDLASLRELVLLEDFRQCLPERVVLYLNEQKVTTLSAAAVLSDEFALTHKTVFSMLHKDKSDLPVSVVRDTIVQNTARPSREKRPCFYCHKVGHVIADCLSLKKKQKDLNLKSAAFAKTVHPTQIDLTYEPFMQKGFVSFSGNPEDQVPVQVLLDTGAAQSFICGSVLPFSEQSYLGTSILVQGIGMEILKVPLHRIHLKTALVTGFVNVGVRVALPVQGAALILGNDLAGGRVFPVLEVLDKPSLPVLDDLAKKFPGVFPACVLTRAQAQKMGSEYMLDDTFLCVEGEPERVIEQGDEKLEIEKVSDVLTSTVTRDNLIKAQKEDSSLTKCFDSVIKAKGSASFFIEHGMLMRKWKPRLVADAECSTVWQVVVPRGYRTQILSLAHDHVLYGHLGVTKTYNRILRHFLGLG